jgi:hypothetical protein
LQLSIEQTASPRLTSCCFTGGKSGRGFGRLNPHLGRGLERPLAELPQQVPHPLFGPVDQMTIRRIIDRIGHLSHGLLEILTHPPNQLLTINLAQAVHGNSFASPSPAHPSI